MVRPLNFPYKLPSFSSPKNLGKTLEYFPYQYQFVVLVWISQDYTLHLIAQFVSKKTTDVCGRHGIVTYTGTECMTK